METNENTIETAVTPVATVETPTTPAVTATTTNRKSMKGKWGKVGAPPKAVKLPRGSFTIKELVALNPQSCELTLRNYVTNNVRGFKVVNGKQVEIPVTLVKLDKTATKETVGRPNFKFMSKAAYDANQKNLTKSKTPKNIAAPSAPTPVAATEAV